METTTWILRNSIFTPLRANARHLMRTRNSGEWINDGATHYTPDGYVDNDGRPDSYVINTSVNSGPSTNMIQTGVSDEVSVLTTVGGALADLTIGLSNGLGMVTSGKQLPYFRLFGTHYCGPGGGGSPNGGVDPACKAHDDCYAAAGLSAASNGAGASLTLDQASSSPGMQPSSLRCCKRSSKPA